MSASVSPVAYSIACDAPCDLGWVIRELYLFSSTIEMRRQQNAMHQSTRLCDSATPSPAGDGCRDAQQHALRAIRLTGFSGFCGGRNLHGNLPLRSQRGRWPRGGGQSHWATTRLHAAMLVVYRRSGGWEEARAGCMLYARQHNLQHAEVMLSEGVGRWAEDVHRFSVVHLNRHN
jgi:hypothetical protein